MTLNQWRQHIIETELSDKAKLVALVLSIYWRSNSIIYPSLVTLEGDCSITKNTIIKAIKELSGAGFISVTKDHVRNSSYKVNIYKLNGVIIAPMNERSNERSNEPSNTSIASAHERDIKEIEEREKIRDQHFHQFENSDFKDLQDVFNIFREKYGSAENIIKIGQITTNLKHNDQVGMMNGWNKNTIFKKAFVMLKLGIVKLENLSKELYDDSLKKYIEEIENE